MTFRFYVRSEDGRVSCPWRLWVSGNEAYLQQRTTPGKHQKFSFHSSGACRWARINEGESGLSRKITEWQRPPIPNRGEGLRSHLLRLIIPTNHLSSHPLSDVAKLNPISAPPCDMATQLDIFISPDDPTVVAELCTQSKTKIIHQLPMRDGNHVYVSSAKPRCTPINLNSPGGKGIPGQVFGNIIFPNIDHTNSGRPVRMIILPNDDPPITVFELGGYEDENARRLGQVGSPLIKWGNWESHS